LKEDVTQKDLEAREIAPLITAPAAALVHSTVPTDKSSPPSIVPPASVAPAAPTPPLATSPPGSVPQAVVPIAPPPAATSPASAALPPPPGWNSAIVADFPKIFEDFKEFTLLWRGSRHGFGAKDFHRRCDGHPNTLTVILDTKDNVFGGFTPLAWDSWSTFKEDPSLKTFVFTLKNPHNVPARRFALKEEKKEMVIWCASDYGPHFIEMAVSDNCNRNTKSYTCDFGLNSINDTELDGRTFLTGSERFQVKEIEVFEVTE
jgi:hypothetical protein